MDNRYYVYAHTKPNGEIFYVGKGSNKRAFCTFGRSKVWEAYTNKYGLNPVFIDRNLSQDQAFELEEFLIAELGTKKDRSGTLVNLTDGGEGSIGRIYTNDQRKRFSEKMKGRFVGDANPAKKTVSRIKIRQSWEDPEIRRRRTEGVRKAATETDTWSKAAIEYNRNPDVKKRKSDHLKSVWADPESRQKLLDARKHGKENGAKALKQVLKNKWEYCKEKGIAPGRSFVNVDKDNFAKWLEARS